MQHEESERAARAAALARAGARCECSDPLCTCDTHPPRAAGAPVGDDRCTAKIVLTRTDADTQFVETSSEDGERTDPDRLVVMCACCMSAHRDTWAYAATPTGE